MTNLILIDIGRKLGGGQVESRIIYEAIKDHCLLFICHPKNKDYYNINCSLIINFLRFFFHRKKIIVFNRSSLLLSLLIPNCEKRIFIVQSIPEKVSRITALMLNFVDGLTFNSQMTRSSWTDRYPRTKSLPCDIIFSPFRSEDLKLANRSLTSYSYRDDPNGVCKILFVGRPMPRKNFPMLIRLLANSNRNFLLTVYGGEKFEYEALDTWTEIEDLFLKSVRFRGFTQDNNIMFEGQDILVLPTSNEPFGRVFIEAYVNNIPAICLGNAGAEEILGKNIYSAKNEPHGILDGIDFYKDIKGKGFNISSPDLSELDVRNAVFKILRIL